MSGTAIGKNMSAALKIDFLTSNMEAGGAQRVISILANYLAEKGYSIRVITITGPDHYELNPKIERIKLHRHPLFHSIVINGFFNLLAFYRKKSNRPDILSSHLDLLGLVSIPNSMIYNIKVTVSEHSNHLAFNNRAQSICWNYLYPRANAVTILTEFDREFFMKRNKNTIVVPNPCTFPILENPRSKIRNKEIVAIGRLNHYHVKGFDNLLLIAKKVFEKESEWRLKIVGEGDTGMKFLKGEAERLGLSDKVEFTGYRSDIREILANAEIYILSSRLEGLPMVILEAMSQGVACISYDCISGPSDIITHNHDGILVEDQNIDAMAAQLLKLMNDDSLRARLGKNAPKALEKFSVEKVGRQWEDIFQSVMLGKGPISN